MDRYRRENSVYENKRILNRKKKLGREKVRKKVKRTTEENVNKSDKLRGTVLRIRNRIWTFLPDPDISLPNPDPDPALVVLKKISVSVQYHAYVYFFTL